jgi:mannose-6-phosphate isomerase-like protein (cupin superfamily)
MPKWIATPSRVAAAGTKPKQIDEHVGRVNTGTAAVSIARMRSPAGWVEPGQTPEFDEYTLVLAGRLQVESRDGVIEVLAGQAVLVERGEWVRYSTPGAEGAEYIAICLPAFSLEAAHRDPD